MSKNISTTPPVSCTLCPRRCGADRAAGQIDYFFYTKIIY